MFCFKCGKQLADDAQFCPNCGTAVISAAEEMPKEQGRRKAPDGQADFSPNVTQKAGRSQYLHSENARQVISNSAGMQSGNVTQTISRPENPVQETAIPSYEVHDGKRSKKKIIIAISAVAAVLVLVVGIAILSISDDAAYLISRVQNGYLGEYDTVTVKEVLEFSCGGGEWKVGEAKNGEYYVVEYESNGLVLQFTMANMGASTFKVAGIAFDDGSGGSAYETKLYLDALYEYYAEEHPGCGIVVNRSLSNDTLQGHVR